MCYSLWYNAPTMLPAASSVHCTTSCNTQSSAPEDGRNYRPKRVELIGIINKPLLLHLVGCLYYCISDARSDKHQTMTQPQGSLEEFAKGVFRNGQDGIADRVRSESHGTVRM